MLASSMRRSKSVPAMWTPWFARMSGLRSIATARRGPDPDDREVGGAAADVGDQNDCSAATPRS
jgi:hypothetical protein